MLCGLLAAASAVAAPEKKVAQIASPKLAIEGIRFGSTGSKTRIVIDFNAKPDFRAFLLENPRRLAVDVPPVVWKAAMARASSEDLIRVYRSGRLEKEGLVRIIFDLAKPAVVDSAFVMDKEPMAKDRVVIDLKPSSQNLFRAATEKVWGNRDLKGTDMGRAPARSAMAERRDQQIARAAVPPASPVLQPAKRGKKIHTIVLDPGHGGQDPGAESRGVREKALTLNIARELKRQLEETGRYRVVLTRDGDYYIKLRERLAFSRRQKGDLFISLHADKLPGRSGVRGASIYTLSQTASDEETESLAESENNAGVVAGVDLADKSGDVADILLDLAMREKMNESNIFAQAVEQSLRRKNVRLLPNSHRSAGFAVLKAPDVPAILIETGFLSNPDEAKLLSSGAFQQKFSGAVVEGVEAYFRKMQALQRD